MATKQSLIVRVDAQPLDIAMKKHFGIASGAQTEAKNLLVRIVLDNEIVGYGEGAPFPAFNGETQNKALAACDRAALLLDGYDIHSSNAIITERLDRAMCLESPSAVCAIETAIVDARAKLEGLSLHAMFGGAQDHVVTDVTITTGTVADAEREARAFAAFRTLKIKVGAANDFDRDVARVCAIAAARPDARLLIDANGGFSVDQAIRYADELKRRSIAIALFEQPIAPGSWDALAEVRAKTGLRIAIDESVTCADDVTTAAKTKAADAINVKIMKSGIFEALAIIERTKREGLIQMIGGLVETRLAMGTSACIAAGLGNFDFIDLDTPLFLATDPFAGGYTQEGDRIDLAPITLGHGITPRP